MKLDNIHRMKKNNVEKQQEEKKRIRRIRKEKDLRKDIEKKLKRGF